MEKIRLATQEEIAGIKDRIGSPLNRSVWAFPSKENTPDFAVIRNCVELDPLIFSSTSDVSRRALMVWGMEHIMKGAGVPEYFFNVHASDDKWNHVVETWGAERTSTEPEYRYRVEIR